MKFVLSFALCVALASVGFAQSPGADPGHPNAELLVDGSAFPTVFGTNDYIVAGTVGLNVSSAVGAGEAVILLSGELDVGGFPVPWGGSIDLTAVVVVADGFGGSTGTILDQFATTPFSLGFSVGGINGCVSTVQAVCTDPTNSPIALRNSIAARLCANTTETCYTISDDGFVQHTLVHAPDIDFTGGSYSSLYIGSNGVISFNAGDTDFTESMSEFFAGFQFSPTPAGSANPGIALCYSDLNRGGTGSGATYCVVEDTANGNVTVEYRNQNHWSSQEPAGDFSCEFINNSWTDTRVDYTNFIPGVTSTDDIIVGVTDGDDTDGGTDTDLSDGLGTGISGAIAANFTPAGGTESIGEEIPANTAFGQLTWLYFDVGGTGGGDWDLLP